MAIDAVKATGDELHRVQLPLGMITGGRRPAWHPRCVRHVSHQSTRHPENLVADNRPLKPGISHSNCRSERADALARHLHRLARTRTSCSHTMFWHPRLRESVLPMDQYWNLGMREHFYRLAAENDRGDAMTTMR